MVLQGPVPRKRDHRQRFLSNWSLTDKDWGDIVRWVLPEAKVPFFLKDLKKRDQILAKLATLPNDWTTYIPPKEVVPIIPPTTVEEAV
jgi:hypothetical protein